MKKKSEEKSEALQKQVEEWKNKYVRALADYQNLERRSSEEKEDVRRFAAEVVWGRLLPFIDTFERARVHLKDTGLELAGKELAAILSEQGLGKIDTVGKQFNPHEMECIEVVAGKDNEVIEEVLAGYRLHNKILRVAQVKVGKGG